VTAQGHPRTIFRRAIEHGNLLIAETTVRELGVVSLSEALELTALVAQNDRARGERYAARWLHRYLEERDAGAREAALAAVTLDALGGPHHAEALALLRAFAASVASRIR
jgi:hypothetical protein